MTQKMEVYVCEKCGNIVEMLHGGKGQLVCCGEPMKKQDHQTADWKNEKHVPIYEEIDGGTLVKVGSTAHPMTEEHYIEWIEIINGDYINRKYLHPGDKPEAVFYVKADEDMILREFCNIHGLWANKK
ncbi:MAG: desulfoferrodoxin [Candidatus Zixiibacteriota bacterium]